MSDRTRCALRRGRVVDRGDDGGGRSAGSQPIVRRGGNERRSKTPIGIVAAVVGLAAIGVVPIVVAAIAGSLATVPTGCLDAQEACEAVQWDVIFLSAGGIALESSGVAGVVEVAGRLPPLVVLAVFSLVTATLNADPLAFVVSVTFAASTAFATPVGHRTNPFVYDPGGYRFSDYVRVDGPLQLVFAIVTPIGVRFLFG